MCQPIASPKKILKDWSIQDLKSVKETSKDLFFEDLFTVTSGRCVIVVRINSVIEPTIT